jgi:hypothetical protein
VEIFAWLSREPGAAEAQREVRPAGIAKVKPGSSAEDGVREQGVQLTRSVEPSTTMVWPHVPLRLNPN